MLRLTVLVSDIIVYIPACLVLMWAMTKFWKTSKWVGFCSLLLNPSLILIDHGHFQYNNLSLGPTLFAIAFIIQDRPLLASIGNSRPINLIRSVFFSTEL